MQLNQIIFKVKVKDSFKESVLLTLEELQIVEIKDNLFALVRNTEGVVERVYIGKIDSYDIFSVSFGDEFIASNYKSAEKILEIVWSRLTEYAKHTLKELERYIQLTEKNPKEIIEDISDFNGIDYEFYSCQLEGIRNDDSVKGSTFLDFYFISKKIYSLRLAVDFVKLQEPSAEDHENSKEYRQTSKFYKEGLSNPSLSWIFANRYENEAFGSSFSHVEEYFLNEDKFIVEGQNDLSKEFSIRFFLEIKDNFSEEDFRKGVLSLLSKATPYLQERYYNLSNVFSYAFKESYFSELEQKIF